MRNYYNILGISESASNDEIEKAYRELKSIYPNNKNIKKAYYILSNNHKKKVYDELLKDNLFPSFNNNSSSNYSSQSYSKMTVIKNGKSVTKERISVNNNGEKKNKYRVMTNDGRGNTKVYYPKVMKNITK